MTSKVFGIGWAKTGTTTLGACFRILGYRHQTQNLDLVMDYSNGDIGRIIDVARRNDSFEDWPWLLLYREFDEAFPGSRFVLTCRPVDEWVTSYRNMLERQGPADGELNEIRRTLYDLPFPDVPEEQLIERYRQHNEEVMAYFADRPGDLLVVDWTRGDGWPELCGFLGCDVPDEAFPHENRGDYGSANILDRAKKAVVNLKESLGVL